MPLKRPLSVLLLAALLGGCMTAPAMPEHALLNVLSVNGTGRVSVKPDTALVNVGVEGRAAALADATADVGRRVEAVLARVKASGVGDKDITTVAYSVEPLVPPRRSAEESSRIVGYRVVNVVRLRIRDVAAVGGIVDGAVAAGVNTVSALQFTVNDPAQASREARALAVKEAAAKAKEIAAAAGVQLGEAVSLTEDGAPRPLAARMAPMASAPSGPGPVEAGQLEIVVSVHVLYRITPR